VKASELDFANKY